MKRFSCLSPLKFRFYVGFSFFDIAWRSPLALYPLHPLVLETSPDYSFPLSDAWIFQNFKLNFTRVSTLCWLEPERMRGKIKDFSEFQVDIVVVFVLKLFFFFCFSTALPEPEKISLKSLHIWDLFSLLFIFDLQIPSQKNNNTAEKHDDDEWNWFFSSCPTRKITRIATEWHHRRRKKLKYFLALRLPWLDRDCSEPFCFAAFRE